MEPALFLKEYIKVEPYITVFGVEKSGVTELVEEVQSLTDWKVETEKEIAERKDKVIKLYAKMEELRTQNRELAKRFNRLDTFIKRWLKYRMSEDELEELGQQQGRDIEGGEEVFEEAE